jgi:hypothetical protein
MLNVLLYLADILKIPPKESIRVFLLELLKRHVMDLVETVVYEENILEICEVGKGFLESVVA